MTEKQHTPTNEEMRSAWLAYRLDHDRFGKEFYGHGAELNAEFDRFFVRIKRPVPTTDEPQGPEIVTLHLYRDSCGGGLFLAARELDLTLHQHVQELVIRRDRLPSPSLPTREQIAEAIYTARAGSNENWHKSAFREDYMVQADAVLALIQKGADR